MQSILCYCITTIYLPTWSTVERSHWVRVLSKAVVLLANGTDVWSGKELLKMWKLWQLVSTRNCEWGWLAGGGFGGGWADWCWVEGSTGPTLEGLDRSQPSHCGSAGNGTGLRGCKNQPWRPGLGTPSWLVTRTNDSTYLKIITLQCGPCFKGLVFGARLTPSGELFHMGQIFFSFLIIQKSLKS